jgi:exopolyphosphatase / guanosine-5'-triphosphate,3'-diphosphate pyrophosphatase
MSVVVSRRPAPPLADAMLAAGTPSHEEPLMQNGTRLAAVDLGSNSFRLEIGRIDQGQFIRTEYLKETVRQGSGLDDNRNLTDDAMQRGLDCLARFGERLAGFGSNEVRAVATQTLREARNRDDFLARANKTLGFPIDVISGREEARLIYQGVAHMLPVAPERRLVVDIGGRSTELILGRGLDPIEMESYRLGSIAWSTRYFGSGHFTPQAFQMAEIAAKAVLDEAQNVYRRIAWDNAYGSAGTVGAVGDVLAASGWPSGSVTRDGLDWLLDKLVQAQSVDRLRLPGMREDRKPIIGGGLSILRALFDLLQIDELHQASGGLRHGLICDLMGGADEQANLPSISVRRLAKRFASDTVHGERVASVACGFLKQLYAMAPSKPGDLQQDRHLRKLDWAGQLHEIGAQISHNDYHKHGAYILDNSDAMGLTLTQLHRLSLLVLGHRGKLRKLEADFDDWDFVAQLLCLRLAVILCHARRDPDTTGMRLEAKQAMRTITLACKSDWSESFPQSAHLLREEVVAWQKTPWSLALLDI